MIIPIISAQSAIQLGTDRDRVRSGRSGEGGRSPNEVTRWEGLCEKVVKEWMDLIDVNEADVRAKLNLLVDGLKRGYGLTHEEASRMVVDRWNAALWDRRSEV